MGKYAVNVDYILELVIQLKDARGNLKQEHRERVQREVNSSPSLRMKSDLIDAFLSQLQGKAPRRTSMRWPARSLSVN